jgi:polysaccharide biosynthesis protein PslH
MMRILQLCHKPPVPAVDGGCIAMLASLKAIMHAGHQVKVLAIETPKHPFVKNADNAELVEQTKMETFFVDTSLKPLSAILNLFSNKSYNVSRFYSPGFEEVLINTLQRDVFDVVQIESLFAAPYIDVIRKSAPNCKIILRAHNVEHIIWEIMAEKAGVFKGIYLNLLAARLKSYELNIFQRVDGIIGISSDDVKKINSYAPETSIKNIPVNVDVLGQNNNKGNSDFFFIGAFDWNPNLVGINWFLKEVWSNVKQNLPEISFNIAGRKMLENLKPLPIENVVYLGEVPDSRYFMEQHGIMVVPLFAGSGIRVKILEAMALGKAVISTTLGAEGIACEPGKEIIIANTAAEFINAMEKCCNNPAFVAEIGTNARKFVLENFSTDKLAQDFSEFYKSLR